MDTPPASATPTPTAGPAREKLAGGFFFQSLSNFSGLLTSLLLMPVVIKVAGPDTFGAFVVLNTLLTLTAQAFTLGSGFKCRRQLPAQDSPAGRAALFLPNASFQLLTHLAAAGLLLLLLPWIQRELLDGSPPLAWWVVPFAVAAIYLNMLGDDYFRYTQRLRLVAYAALARSLVYAGLVVHLALASEPLTPGRLLAAQSAATFVPALWLWTRIGREMKLSFRLEAWTQHRWDIRYGLPLLTAVLVENLLATSDRYILAGLLTPAHVGAYAAAFAVGSLILLVPKVVSAVLPAALAEEVDRGRPAEAAALLGRALRFYFALAVPFAAGCALVARPALLMLGDAEVAELGRWPLPLIAIGSILYGYTWIVFSSLFVEMDTRLWFRANFAAAVVSIALNLVLVAVFQRIEAAACAMIASYFVSTLVIERGRNRAWPAWPGLSGLGRIFAATGVMSTAVALLLRWPALAGSPALQAVLPATAGIAVYAVTLWRLGGLPLGELRQLLRRPR